MRHKGVGKWEATTMHGLGKGRIWIPPIVAIGMAATAGATPPASHAASTPAGAAATGSHGFDFEYGRWRVHHRVKRADGTWQEFEGTSETRPMLDGQVGTGQLQRRRPKLGYELGDDVRTGGALIGP